MWLFQLQVSHLSLIAFTRSLQSSRSFEHLRENVARVRDIELLTGLTFFTDLETSLRIKTETYLPEHLWSRISWMDTDDQCPDLSQGAQCPPQLVAYSFQIILGNKFSDYFGE